MKIKIDRKAFMHKFEAIGKAIKAKYAGNVRITAFDDGRVFLEALNNDIYVKLTLHGGICEEAGNVIVDWVLFKKSLKTFKANMIEITDDKIKADGVELGFTCLDVKIECPDISESNELFSIATSDFKKFTADGTFLQGDIKPSYNKFAGAATLKINDGAVECISATNVDLSFVKTDKAEIKQTGNYSIYANDLNSAGGLSDGERVTITANSQYLIFISENMQCVITRLCIDMPNFQKLIYSRTDKILQVSSKDFVEGLDVFARFAKENKEKFITFRLSPDENKIKAAVIGSDKKDCLKGEIKIAKYTGDTLDICFLISQVIGAMKALGGDVIIKLSGAEDAVKLYRADDENFLYLFMPCRDVKGACYFD